jgi:hypothetical protein
MIGEPSASASIITDPEILPELVRPLVTAFQATPYDAVVDTGAVGRDRNPAWLLPTRVTVRVGLSPLMFHLLQDLKVGTGRLVPAALASLYAEIEARYGGASAPVGRRSFLSSFTRDPGRCCGSCSASGCSPEISRTRSSTCPRCFCRQWRGASATRNSWKALHATTQNRRRMNAR